jgi:hypothetical protein
MLSMVSVAPPETAHKTVSAETIFAPGACPCLALVPAGFFPRVPPPPVRVSATDYWLSRFGDLTYITKHLKAGRTVAAQCSFTWCLFAAHHIGLTMSGIMQRAGFPHRVELRFDAHTGVKTLLFIPEEK